MKGKNIIYLGNKFKIFYIIGRTKKYGGEEKFSIMYSLAVKYDDTKVQKSAWGHRCYRRHTVNQP